MRRRCRWMRSCVTNGGAVVESCRSGGDAEYTASFYYNLRNFSADKYGRYVMVNAGLGWTNDTWGINFRGQKHHECESRHPGLRSWQAFCGCNEVSYKPPRYFEIGARYNF